MYTRYINLSPPCSIEEIMGKNWKRCVEQPMRNPRT
jgi:hypothetical protein